MKVFLTIAFFVASAFALADKEKSRRALQNPDLFQGDILGIEPGDRNVINIPKRRWPNRTIPFEIDPSVDGVMGVILDGMDEYHRKTCIRFKERTYEENYIKIFAGDGCYSYVGMTGDRGQPVSLGEGCYYVGTVVHELGHAVGFFHEQNRSDRDDYIDIFWNNIEKGMESQFNKHRPEMNLLLTPFDYDSIMMYGNYAFTIDGTRKTMEARNGRPLREPYDKKGLTDSDAQRVNRMYECHGGRN